MLHSPTRASNTGWTGNTVDIIAYAGQPSAQFAWIYNDGGGWLFGYMMDNIEIKEAPQLDPDLRAYGLRWSEIFELDFSLDSRLVFIRGLFTCYRSFQKSFA